MNRSVFHTFLRNKKIIQDHEVIFVRGIINYISRTLSLIDSFGIAFKNVPNKSAGSSGIPWLRPLVTLTKVDGNDLPAAISLVVVARTLFG